MPTEKQTDTAPTPAEILAALESMRAAVGYLWPESFDDDEHEQTFTRNYEDATDVARRIRLFLIDQPTNPQE